MQALVPPALHSLVQPGNGFFHRTGDFEEFRKAADEQTIGRGSAETTKYHMTLAVGSPMQHGRQSAHATLYIEELQ